jgi:hypothetical protein
VSLIMDRASLKTLIDTLTLSHLTEDQKIQFYSEK